MYTVKKGGDKSGMTCSIIHYSIHTVHTGHKAQLIAAHGGHTEEWTVVMGYISLHTSYT